MTIEWGREICSNLEAAAAREWLVTNGTGSYASGTVAGMLTRCYHGLLVAALKPPLERTLMLTKLDETALYDKCCYPLFTNRWADGTVDPQGYFHLEHFQLQGTIPLWRFACADALVEKRVWMQPGVDATYIRYNLHRATQPLTLTIRALVNYRNHHGNTLNSDSWQMKINAVEQGIWVSAFPDAVPLHLLADRGNVSVTHQWYYGFDLAQERYRGLSDREDHLHAATFQATLQPGESLTLVATTESNPHWNGKAGLEVRRTYEQKLLERWQDTRNQRFSVANRSFAPNSPRPRVPASSSFPLSPSAPQWVQHLVLAADQFIVNRSLPEIPDGKTIIAGYHWFTDWGRDIAISLPGLTISTARSEVASTILRTFAHYVNQGMLPNCFPDGGEQPAYNAIDAPFWYFEAIRAYYAATGDYDLLRELFPVLAEIIAWHHRGTRHHIHLDHEDGLLYGGEEGVQLTWMDAKVDDWVVTPRVGKPIEVNALWYNALRTMTAFAQRLGLEYQDYERMAQQTEKGFQRFWNEELGYCYDVLNDSHGHDASLRPNQIFAVSLPQTPLTPTQQRSVVEVCSRTLLTSHGLRSLSPNHPQYQGHYGGDRLQRDSAYHQGTVWGWLIGPFALAHLRVFENPTQAHSFLEPMANQLNAHGVGSLSEIFDGDAPMTPRGCIAQAWTVAEVLRAWQAIERFARGRGVNTKL